MSIRVRIVEIGKEVENEFNSRFVTVKECVQYALNLVSVRRITAIESVISYDGDLTFVCRNDFGSWADLRPASLCNWQNVTVYWMDSGPVYPFVCQSESELIGFLTTMYYEYLDIRGED
jgi:hypothetical protein